MAPQWSWKLQSTLLVNQGTPLAQQLSAVANADKRKREKELRRGCFLQLPAGLVTEVRPLIGVSERTGPTHKISRRFELRDWHVSPHYYTVAMTWGWKCAEMKIDLTKCMRKIPQMEAAGFVKWVTSPVSFEGRSWMSRKCHRIGFIDTSAIKDINRAGFRFQRDSTQNVKDFLFLMEDLSRSFSVKVPFGP